ncbi:MAG: hypothetical protein COB17_02605 [Sulfurimonas sp.]|nr:MAG: hypothetical protein COB17_02605 [Sulfurimonas sp.]
MISNPLVYLFSLAFLATFFYLLESKFSWKIFKFIPSVVMIYAFSMALASMGIFEYNEEINAIYKTTKTNLLPAMLFLMLLQVDLRHFLKLGRPLLISYVLAVASIAFAFIFISYLFDFCATEASAFGALAGSWMGGTANMIAVGSALNVSHEAFGYALIVDSVNYTIWVMFLLFLVPFASYFNKFTGSEKNKVHMGDIGCACHMGAKRYWLLIFFALFASMFSQVLSHNITFLNQTTTIVIIASLLGVIGSFTALKTLNGSSEVATTMLYVIIALIGSKAVFESFESLGTYVLAGFLILLIHAIIMIIGAKIFKLDLFSVAVASLSNIGGIASAPILAATYDKALVSVGVLMAIMGYIIGTFGGLAVGNILIMLAK